MKNSYGEEQEAMMNPGDMLYFPAGMWHSVETIEEGILNNISLMSSIFGNSSYFDQKGRLAPMRC